MLKQRCSTQSKIKQRSKWDIIKMSKVGKQMGFAWLGGLVTKSHYLRDSGEI